MSYEKQYFADGQTLTAAQLNHMEEGIAAAAGVKGDPGDKGEKGDPGEGLTPNAKQLLLTLFENAAYKTGDGQPTLNALRTEWGFSVQPDVPVQSVSLSAAELTLNEGESQTLTVTVLPANATGSVAFSISAGGFATAGNPVKLAANVYSYRVTAVKAGTCTAKATAGGKSAQCTVRIQTTAETATLAYELAQAKTFVPAHGESIDTGVKLFADITQKPSWTILGDITGGTALNNTLGNTYCVMHCMNEADPWPGLSMAVKVNNHGYGVNIYNIDQPIGQNSAKPGGNMRFAIVLEGESYKIYASVLTSPVSGTISGYNTAVSQSLILGAYQMTNGSKGRFYDGTINRFKVYRGVCTQATIEGFLNG